MTDYPYGLLPDRARHAEMLRAAPPLVRVDGMPLVQDLRPWMPPRMYQISLGTCGCHSGVGIGRFDLINSGAPDIELSRLLLYFAVRKKMGLYPADSGAYMHDIIACMCETGLAREELWPYDVTKFNDEPSPEAWADAATRRALEPRAVASDTLSIRAALWTGRPVALGFEVFKQFESDEAFETGFVRLPAAGETPIAAHDMLGCCFNIRPGCIGAQNWWEGWGDENGMGHFEDGYFERYGTDCWTYDRIQGENNVS